MSYAKNLREKGKAPIIKKGNHYDTEIIKPELSEDIPSNLEEIETQIDKLKGRVGETAWLIGKRLIFIRDNLLKGTRFENISDYAEYRFGFKQRTAYNYIFVATHFTRLQSIAIGSKLYLLERLSENKRIEYLEWIQKDDPSRKEIEEKIKAEKSPRIMKDISIGTSRMIVNFREMGVKIQKEKQNDFLREIEKLIKKYSS